MDYNFSTKICILIYLFSIVQIVSPGPLPLVKNVGHVKELLGNSIEKIEIESSTLRETAKNKNIAETVTVNVKSESAMRFPSEVEDCMTSGYVKCNVTTDKKVCGSDGKSYGSVEQINCLVKLCKTDLKLQSEGPCDQDNKTFETTTDNSRKGRNRLKLAEEVTTECIPDLCGCSDDLLVICGTDGVTYGNECLLNCNRKCSPKVEPFHDGYCGSILFRDEKTGKLQPAFRRNKTFALRKQDMDSVKNSGDYF